MERIIFLAMAVAAGLLIRWAVWDAAEHGCRGIVATGFWGLPACMEAPGGR
jgi:hypothetical protein